MRERVPRGYAVDSVRRIARPHPDAQTVSRLAQRDRLWNRFAEKRVGCYLDADIAVRRCRVARAKKMSKEDAVDMLLRMKVYGSMDHLSSLRESMYRAGLSRERDVRSLLSVLSRARLAGEAKVAFESVSAFVNGLKAGAIDDWIRDENRLLKAMALERRIAETNESEDEDEDGEDEDL